MGEGFLLTEGDQSRYLAARTGFQQLVTEPIGIRRSSTCFPSVDIDAPRPRRSSTQSREPCFRDHGLHARRWGDERSKSRSFEAPLRVVNKVPRPHVPRVSRVRQGQQLLRVLQGFTKQSCIIWVTADHAIESDDCRRGNIPSHGQEIALDEVDILQAAASSRLLPCCRDVSRRRIDGCGSCDTGVEQLERQGADAGTNIEQRTRYGTRTSESVEQQSSRDARPVSPVSLEV